jgi:hypothetical protein
MIQFKTMTAIPEDVADYTICSIDMGFAKTQATVGLAFHLPRSEAWNKFDSTPPESSFGDALKLLKDWLLNPNQTSLKGRILILEAPLSRAFSDQECPCHRDVELRRNYFKDGKLKSPKGWFYGAGACMSLAAFTMLEFLQSLSFLDSGEMHLHLIEGFYSKHSAEGGDIKHTHTSVANHLLHETLKSPPPKLHFPRSECGRPLRSLSQELMGDLIPSILLRRELQLIDLHSTPSH